VAVMYLGQIVEMGEARRVLDAPSHPYTRLLMDSVPRIGAPLGDAPRNTELPGNRHLPEGCYFRERCPFASAGCEQPQPLRPLANGSAARCWKAESLAVTAVMS
ncbi:peptide ABC transporter ATP-binding protein, partial [Bacillus sp. SRB_28]